nr:hypothetical protein B0A51_09054 [Rachicladosporium sp. CCFEE 5018]
MADPVSSTGLVLQVGVLLKHLVEYGKAVKGAQGEIGRLRTETYALRSILRDIETAQENAGKRPLKRELSETLTTASSLSASWHRSSMARNIAKSSPWSGHSRRQDVMRCLAN